MDCGKAVALLVNHPTPLEQYALVNGGLSKITSDRPPVICVPTTAGTGSEVGRAALLTMSSGRKLALVSPHLIPDAAVCDPALTLGLPPTLTAATGMDAISHCVETFCSPRFNPVADAIALDGLARACINLERAVAHGGDLDARTEMMMAALEGGLTFQKGLGAVHALSHPLGALEHRRLHHGTLNALFLPHVLRFNADACPDRMTRMSQALGLTNASDLPRHFDDLVARLSLPTRLRDMGVTREEALGIAADAVRDHCAATNPRPLTVEECHGLLDAAY
jgi:alcohol dehydrogenase class IV